MEAYSRTERQPYVCSQKDTLLVFLLCSVMILFSSSSSRFCRSFSFSSFFFVSFLIIIIFLFFLFIVLF